MGVATITCTAAGPSSGVITGTTGSGATDDSDVISTGSLPPCAPGAYLQNNVCITCPGEVKAGEATAGMVAAAAAAAASCGAPAVRCPPVIVTYTASWPPSPK